MVEYRAAILGNRLAVLNNRLKALSAGPSAELPEILKKIVDVQRRQAELSKSIGDRIILPKRK